MVLEMTMMMRADQDEVVQVRLAVVGDVLADMVSLGPDGGSLAAREKRRPTTVLSLGGARPVSLSLPDRLTTYRCGMFLAGWFESAGGIGTAIGVLSIVIAVTLSVSIYLLQRQTKTLDWEPRGLAVIVRKPVGSVSAGLRLSWNGTPLSTPYVAKIRISNTGRAAILQSDYLTPVTLDFGSASTCYEATISAVSTKGVVEPGLLMSRPSSSFALPEVTMNARDWFELSVVADGQAGYPEFTSRIAGQSRDMQNAYSVRSRTSLWISILFFVAGIIVLASTYIYAGIYPDQTPASVLVWAGLFGSICISIGLSRLVFRSLRRASLYDSDL